MVKETLHFNGHMGDKFAIYDDSLSHPDGQICIKQWWESGQIMGLIRLRKEDARILVQKIEEYLNGP